MISFLLGLVNPLSQVITEIAKAKIAAENAKTDQERIHSEERIRALQGRRDVLVAEAPGSHINAYMRAGFALPFLIYNAKLILWDKLLMAGTTSTDPLSTELYQVEMACIGFYFLYEATARLLRGK